jgi:hypothetical protein
MWNIILQRRVTVTQELAKIDTPVYTELWDTMLQAGAYSYRLVKSEAESPESQVNQTQHCVINQKWTDICITQE